MSWIRSLFSYAGFDRMAPHYDRMETLLAGGLMMRARMEFIEAWPVRGRVLLAGEGHGKFLIYLCRKRPELQITCVDASRMMLDVARQRLCREKVSARNVTFLQADLLTCDLEKYDVISTQFFLDCYEGNQLEHLLLRLVAVANPGALWFHCDFSIPASGLPRLRARLIVFLMYQFFRMATQLPAGKLEDPLPVLRGAGFVLKERKTWSWGLLHAVQLLRCN